MNVIEQNPNDIISDTKIQSCGNECKSTGKVWERKCPKCNNILSYTIYGSYWNAVHNNRLCRSCVRKKRYPLPIGIWIDTNEDYCRNCPECNDVIKYRGNKHVKYRVIKAHINNKICSLCSHKKQSETLKRIRENQKIKLTCLICGNVFEVFSNRFYTKCCSQKCRQEARKRHIISSEVRERMSEEEIKLADKLYKYKEWDRIHNMMCDWDLPSLREAIKNGKCEYCERKEWLGLDRINNAIGHSKGNTVICCELCNMTKGTRFTYDEMKIIGQTIKSLNINDRRNTRQGKNNNIFRNQ